MSDVAVGVGVMLLSTSSLNVGAVLQKKAVDGLPPLEDLPVRESLKAVLRQKLWLLGWALGSAGIVLNWVALGFADMSLVQPLNGFGLVVLALFSRGYLGERLTPAVLGGIGVLVAGLVVLGSGAAAGREWTEVEALYACYVRPRGLAALIGLTALTFGLWPFANRSPRAGVVFAFLAAAASVLGLTFAKGLSTAVGVQGIGGASGSWPPYVLLATTLGFSTLAIVLQQLSFQKGLAVVVTPVFGATSVVLPLGIGALVFEEALTAPTLLGAALIAAGVVVLGASGGPSRAAAEPSAA